MRTSACSPITASVCAHCAVPGSSISQTTWIGFSTRTFFGTWMKTPPVQNAAVPAGNMPSSIGSRLPKCSRTSSSCSSTACSSGMTTIWSSSMSVCTTLAPRWTISAEWASSPRSRSGSSVS
jgi:hypothetical protein